jgi:hypothetical protein
VGLTASATVNITVTGQLPIPIGCGTNIHTAMTTNNSIISTYAAGNCANTYTFAGEPNQAMTVNFSGDSGIQCYVYDPDTQTTNLIYNSLTLIAQSTNNRAIEVVTIPGNLTTHSNYNLSLSCANTNVPNMAVVLGTNGVIPNGGWIDFGVTPVGLPVPAYLTITNHGTTNLNIWSDGFNPGNFSFDPGNGNFILTDSPLTNSSWSDLIVIPAGSSTNLTL